MPPDDEVNVRFTESGAAKVSSASEKVANSLDNVKKSGEGATESTANLDQGMTALSAVAGQVDPKLGFFVSTMNTLKVATTGAAGGLRSVGAALAGIVRALGGPIFLAAAAAFFLISRAVRAAREETEKLNQAKKETEERIKAETKARDEQFQTERERGLRSQAEVERQLVRAGRDPALAPGVILRAQEFAEQRQVPLERAVSRELIRTILTTRFVPQERRIEGLRGGAAGELLSRDIQESREGLAASRKQSEATARLRDQLLDDLRALETRSATDPTADLGTRLERAGRADEIRGRLRNIRQFRLGREPLSERNLREVVNIEQNVEQQNIFYGPVNQAPDQFNPANGPGPTRQVLQN